MSLSLHLFVNAKSESSLHFSWDCVYRSNFSTCGGETCTNDLQNWDSEFKIIN